MAKWEYKVVSLEPEGGGGEFTEEGQEVLFNTLGQEGWELVAVVSIATPKIPANEYSEEEVEAWNTGSAYFRREIT